MTYIAEFAEAAVPRYTSYPSANLFTAQDDSVASRWLKSLDHAKPLSLYIHVPFCRTLCWYCGCHTSVTRKREPVAAYADLLLKEIELVGRRLDASHDVSHLHFGGGTPNSLEPDDLHRIMTTLRRYFRFLDDAEIAIELDPRVLTDGFVEAIGKEGFNRASLGIQDVSPDVQKLINRVQTAEQVESAVTRLRDAGIERINFDLLYGLPGQSTDHVLRSADAAVQSGADRVAVFGYAHVPWFKKHQQVIDESMLAGGAERFVQARGIEERLVERGMVAIGLDHFAKADDPLAIAHETRAIRRNFQGYTTDEAETMIGFGPSSISRLPQGYLQNEPHLGRYREAIDAGKLATVRGIELSDDDQFRADLIEELMCHGIVDIDAVCSRHGRDRSELAEGEARLAPLLSAGLAAYAGSRLEMTNEGRPYVRCAAACFDRYFQAGIAKHSKAV